MGHETTEATPEAEAPTFGAILGEFSEAFTRDKRDDGKEFTKRKDDAPAWIDASVMRGIHEAVDGRFPDDWIYENAAAFASNLTGYTFDDADDAREHVSEIADGLVDVYTAALTEWLSDHLGNVALCDEAAEESGDTAISTEARIAGGQYLALQRIGNAVIDAIDAELTERS